MFLVLREKLGKEKNLYMNLQFRHFVYIQSLFY